MARSIGSFIRFVLLCTLGVASMFAASGCSALYRNALPEDKVAQASVPGMPNVRFWGDVVTPGLEDWLRQGYQREREYLLANGVTQWPDSSYLALSGGGSDGAFGAGLLCGWSAHGDRPTFRVVTGVSAGALIAPFAFAGSKYDYVLREVFTSISTEDIGSERGIISGLLNESLLDPAPLRRIIEKHVTHEFLEHVAGEYRKGRGLVLSTTNMDSQRPVVWAMGAIAASGHPDSLRLFQDVMMASSAIPGVFPPVLITVEADGRRYQEMHADGGVTSQVFLYPAALSIKQAAEAAGVIRKRSVYVVRNAKISPTFKIVPRRTLPIASRAVSTLILTQGVGDLYRIYLGCVRDEIAFRLAVIPEDFSLVSKEDFDPVYMTKLFEVAQKSAEAGYSWLEGPPGFEPPAVGQPGLTQPVPAMPGTDPVQVKERIDGTR